MVIVFNMTVINMLGVILIFLEKIELIAFVGFHFYEWYFWVCWKLFTSLFIMKYFQVWKLIKFDAIYY